MGTRIGPMYRQLEKEADRLRKNGAGGEADKLYGQASQMRLNRSSNIAASGENQAERVGYAAGQAGLVESRRRSQLEQQQLDREAQAQTTRLTAAQAGALESQNRGGVGTKPSIAPNSALASTPRPSAAGGKSLLYNPDNGVTDTQSPASSRPSLVSTPRSGVTPEEKERIAALRGKTDAVLNGGKPDAPGNLADLRRDDASSRQDAITAARSGSGNSTASPLSAARDRIDRVRKESGLPSADYTLDAEGNPRRSSDPITETLATRGSVIEGINANRKAQGKTPFDDSIYGDIAKADISERDTRVSQTGRLAKLQEQNRVSAERQTAIDTAVSGTNGEDLNKLGVKTYDLAGAQRGGAAEARKDIPLLAARPRTQILDVPNRTKTPAQLAEEKRKKDRKA